MWPAKAALVRNYLEVYWPCAGGLSAVNAIGTQLRDPINSGLTRWRMAVLNKAAAELGRNPASKHQIQPELFVVFFTLTDRASMVMEMSRTRLARLSLCRLCVCVFLCSHWSLVDVPLIFFCPADHVPDWQPRVLLGMVEARSVNVKKTTTTTTKFSGTHGGRKIFIFPVQLTTTRIGNLTRLIHTLAICVTIHTYRYHISYRGNT